jgi:hypothetical protein
MTGIQWGRAAHDQVWYVSVCFVLPAYVMAGMAAR